MFSLQRHTRVCRPSSSLPRALSYRWHDTVMYLQSVEKLMTWCLTSSGVLKPSILNSAFHLCRLPSKRNTLTTGPYPTAISLLSRDIAKVIGRKWASSFQRVYCVADRLIITKRYCYTRLARNTIISSCQPTRLRYMIAAIHPSPSAINLMLRVRSASCAGNVCLKSILLLSHDEILMWMKECPFFSQSVRLFPTPEKANDRDSGRGSRTSGLRVPFLFLLENSPPKSDVCEETLSPLVELESDSVGTIDGGAYD